MDWTGQPQKLASRLCLFASHAPVQWIIAIALLSTRLRCSWVVPMLCSTESGPFSLLPFGVLTLNKTTVMAVSSARQPRLYYELISRHRRQPTTIHRPPHTSRHHASRTVYCLCIHPSSCCPPACLNISWCLRFIRFPYFFMTRRAPVGSGAWQAF